MAAARAEVFFTMQVAVMTAREIPRAQIAERLGVSPGDVKQAIARLKDVRESIDDSAPT